MAANNEHIGPRTTGKVRPHQTQNEALVFEKSSPGKRAYKLPPLDVPPVDAASLLGTAARNDAPLLPELSEIEIIRHFTRLSTWNYAIDLGMYPLGSCTMKYNPRVNEFVSRIEGLADAHPYRPDTLAQGILEVIDLLQRCLLDITGMDAITLQPAAGAHGEFTGILLTRAWHESQGNPRRTILIPDSAHGTNPATAAICGYTVENLKSNADGGIDLEALARQVNEDTAALMITNPSTLGVFENQIHKIADILHAKGALLYMDGANMNALVGKVRPGDFGVDVMHLNLHKTFSTPHGGGGPGSGPVACKKFLDPFLPTPVLVRNENDAKPCPDAEGWESADADATADGCPPLFRAPFFDPETGERIGDDDPMPLHSPGNAPLHWDYNRPHSVGRVRAFYGNTGMFIRALAYILANGPDGLRQTTEDAVLNANYIRKKLEDLYELPYNTPSMHEVVFSDKRQAAKGVKTGDIAKRLIDYGFHPYTVSFPLIVPGALMIEPTESESVEELDLFIDAMRSIAHEVEENPELVKTAPRSTRVSRLDEVQAARKPILRWKPPTE
ncbi:MAG TPA: aminomethyl-transferring glycine dehydrogenase subunit GcvPB [Terracidiphilus sp.]|nr:aminomethyl-transferring glycine dehydrogenase subunit GcvPB [Terracidiphilus sp.]